MKSRVDIGSGSAILTFVLVAALAIGLYFTKSEPGAFYTLLVILLILCIAICLYAPLSISADEKEIEVHSSFKIRSIPMSEVTSVERYKPAPGTIRICASGGVWGNWGKFRDNVIGNYTGYFGLLNDCFLVSLANGDKYVLGCKNPDAMVAYIKSNISRK